MIQIFFRKVQNHFVCSPSFTILRLSRYQEYFLFIILVVSDQNGSKGYGFVHFESDEAAQRSIEKVNGMMLAEKKVFVGRFKSRNDRLREFGERAKVR